MQAIVGIGMAQGKPARGRKLLQQPATTSLSDLAHRLPHKLGHVT